MTGNLDAARRTLYIYNEYYQVQCPLWTLADHIREENPGNELIISDVEPRSVHTLRSYGINVRAAKKGPGSREAGYDYLSKELLRIVIDPNRCPNAAREFANYELKKDKNGNFIATYPDGNDHTIDAVNYLCQNKGALRIS